MTIPASNVRPVTWQTGTLGGGESPITLALEVNTILVVTFASITCGSDVIGDNASIQYNSGTICLAIVQNPPLAAQTPVGAFDARVCDVVAEQFDEFIINPPSVGGCSYLIAGYWWAQPSDD